MTAELRKARAGSPPDKPKQQRRSLAPELEIAGENFREFEREEGTHFPANLATHGRKLKLNMKS
jgi:NTP pyrophosphatase (non-canonical NTP hydrolase)